MPPPRYAELATTTNFSFLRGAAHPEEMAATANGLANNARELQKAMNWFKISAGN